MHMNSLKAKVALYVIGYQITICTDWSCIPINEVDYKLSYEDKWSESQ